MKKITHRHSQEVELAHLLQELPGHVAAGVIESVQLRLLLVPPPVLLSGSQGQGDGPHGVVGLRRVLRDRLRKEVPSAGASHAPSPPPTRVRLRCSDTDPGTITGAKSILAVELGGLLAQLGVEHVIVLRSGNAIKQASNAAGMSPVMRLPMAATTPAPIS